MFRLTHIEHFYNFEVDLNWIPYRFRYRSSSYDRRIIPVIDKNGYSVRFHRPPHSEQIPNRDSDSRLGEVETAQEIDKYMIKNQDRLGKQGPENKRQDNLSAINSRQDYNSFRKQEQVK